MSKFPEGYVELGFIILSIANYIVSNEGMVDFKNSRISTEFGFLVYTEQTSFSTYCMVKLLQLRSSSNYGTTVSGGNVTKM